MKKAYSGNSANERPNHGVDYSDADVPPPPKVFGNIKESECPYCFVVCSKEELSGTRWKWVAAVLVHRKISLANR
jgi:hypothetical protein